LLLAVAACAPANSQVERPFSAATAPVAHSTNGMVVSGAPLASAVGAHVLAQGGNAVDAAVATAFALAVVEPTMSGLGGRTQLLVRTPAGAYYGIDGGTAVPAAYPPGAVPPAESAYGYRTIGVPGTVAALSSALERHGTWPLARVLAPAIDLARNGFALTAEEAARIARDSAQLAEFAGSRAYFLKPDGSTFRAGDRFVQRDLARTLETIARAGPQGFYRGAIAEQMAADIQRNGGWLARSDLEQYANEEAVVVRGSYRGYDLIGTYLPASGVTTIEALHILENFDLPAIAGSPEWADLITQALLVAFEDRVTDFGAPDQKAARLVSREHARERAARIRTQRDRSRTPEDIPGASYEPAHTTHLSVADAHGGVVALTQSVGPNLGSKVAAPGLGFLYAATMGYLGDVKPGDRPFSSQSPLIVTRNDTVRYVVGAAGARRIISALVMVMSRVIDQQLGLSEAMAAPRLHALPDRIDLENRATARWRASDIANLRAMGYTVRLRDDAPYFARIHGLQFDPATRAFTGVADQRWQGAAAAPRN
jgi:gamma-glutamyltranspeptidase/glutathione hydrolase